MVLEGINYWPKQLSDEMFWLSEVSKKKQKKPQRWQVATGEQVSVNAIHREKNMFLVAIGKICSSEKSRGSLWSKNFTTTDVSPVNKTLNCINYPISQHYSI